MLILEILFFSETEKILKSKYNTLKKGIILKYTAVSFYLTMNCDLDEEGEIENIDLVIDFAV